jgi:predicted RNase H-like nuclease (RuvC/YqgF family)
MFETKSRDSFWKLEALFEEADTKIQELVDELDNKDAEIEELKFQIEQLLEYKYMYESVSK